MRRKICALNGLRKVFRNIMNVRRREGLVIQSYRGNGVIDCGKICKFENGGRI